MRPRRFLPLLLNVDRLEQLLQSLLAHKDCVQVAATGLHRGGSFQIIFGDIQLMLNFFRGSHSPNLQSLIPNLPLRPDIQIHQRRAGIEAQQLLQLLHWAGLVETGPQGL